MSFKTMLVLGIEAKDKDLPGSTTSWYLITMMHLETCVCINNANNRILASIGARFSLREGLRRLQRRNVLKSWRVSGRFSFSYSLHPICKFCSFYLQNGAMLDSQILASKNHSPWKGTKALWKMADSRAGAGREQDEPEEVSCSLISHYTTKLQ